MIKEELLGLNGNAYSASRYLYYNIKKVNENIIEEVPQNLIGGIILLSTNNNANKNLENEVVNWI